MRAITLKEIAMILLAKTETRVATSASRAYQYLINMERFGEWFPEVISIKSANDMAHGDVGKQYLETVALPIIGHRKIKLCVAEAIKNQRFVTEGNLIPILPRMDIFIAELSDGEILVKWSMFSRSPNKLVQLMLLPSARRILQQRADIASARLKQRLEEYVD
jgi:hypothetical protein